MLIQRVQMDEFNVAITSGRVTLDHKECRWIFLPPERDRASAAVSLDELVNAAQDHLDANVCGPNGPDA